MPPIVMPSIGRNKPKGSGTGLVVALSAVVLVAIVGGIAALLLWRPGSGKDLLAALQGDVLDPEDTRIEIPAGGPEVVENPHSDYEAPELNMTPLPGVSLSAPGGFLDQPRTFQVDALSQSEMRKWQKKLDDRELQVRSAFRCDGGMGPDDRLRKPLTILLDLNALGVEPELWSWTGVYLTGEDGALLDMLVQRNGAHLRFQTNHNFVALLCVGASLITGALVIKAGHESKLETEGKAWNGMISPSGRFNILWPADTYGGTPRYAELNQELQELWKHHAKGTLPPPPAPGVPPPIPSTEALLRRIRAIEKKMKKEGWIRQHWAWPDAIPIEKEVEFAYQYLVKTRGFDPLDRRLNVYLRTPWNKQSNAVGLYEGGLTRNGWMSVNMDRAGKLDRETQLGRTKDGVNLQITLVHELFHAVQEGYATGNNMVWCVEAGAVNLERGLWPTYAGRVGNKAWFNSALTSRDEYWSAYRRQLEIGGTIVGLVQGVSYLQHHGYAVSQFLEFLQSYYAGDKSRFLVDYMTYLRRTGCGVGALEKLAGSKGRLSHLYADFAQEKVQEIWSAFDGDANKATPKLDMAKKPRRFIRAVDVHPSSSPCYTLTLPGKLKRIRDAELVFYLNNLQGSGLTVQIRKRGKSEWRKLTKEVERVDWLFHSKAGSDAILPLQVIGGFVERDWEKQRPANLIMIALIPPQKPPALPRGSRIAAEDLKPDGSLEVKWNRSKISRCPEFAGYRVQVKVSSKGKKLGEFNHEVSAKKDGISIPWKGMLPADVFETGEDDIHLKITYAEVLQAEPKIVGPWSDPAELDITAIGNMKLLTYEGTVCLLGGDKTYEKFTYYKATKRTPTAWPRGFSPPGRPNVWMGSAMTWRWLVEANAGSHGDKVLHGKYLMKYTNGNPCAEANFDHGVLDGAFRVYHEEGGLAGSGSYTKGVPDGKFPEYWIDGSLSRTEIWESGKRKETVNE